MFIRIVRSGVVYMLLAGSGFSLFPAASDSAEVTTGKDSIVSLDKIVVTATRTRRLMSQTPASVSVISEDEIDASPAKNIDDMLQYETGVQVKRVVGMGEGIPSDIIMRGIPGALSATRTLILVDGIPTNASGTPYLILNEVPMGAIQSVELVRGPYSSLYGANAFGGVVNIRTREGYGNPTLTASIETAYPFSVLHMYAVNERSMRTSLRKGGADTYWNISGTSSGGSDRINYMVSGGYRNIGNYLLRDYAITKHDHDTTHKKNENYDYRDVRFFGKCGVALNEHLSAELHARYFKSNLGFGRTKKIKPDSVDIITRGQKVVIGPVFKYTPLENLDFTLRTFYRTLIGGFWNEELDSVKDIYVPGYWRSQSHDWQAELLSIFSLGKAGIITAGFEYLGNYIDFGKKVNAETDSVIPGSGSAQEAIANIALYLQDEIALFDKLNIVPGFRWDYHSDFGSALSPKLGVSWQAIDWMRIRTSAGRAFRAPTLSELYMPTLVIDPDFVLVPNPDLQPEYLWAVESACEITPIPSMKTQIGLFYNNMHDLVVTQVDTNNLLEIIQDPDAQYGITHMNAVEAWAWGVECEFEWQAVPWLNIAANYVFQKTRNGFAGDERKYFQLDKNYTADSFKVPLDYIPEHSFGLRLFIKKNINNFLLESTVSELYVGKRRYLEWSEIDLDPDNPKENDVKIIPGSNSSVEIHLDPPLITLDPYALTNLSIKGTYKNRVFLALNIQNLFDETFEEQGGTLGTGRFASVILGCKF